MPVVGWWHFPKRANWKSTTHRRLGTLPSEAIQPCCKWLQVALEWKSWKELRQQNVSVGLGWWVFFGAARSIELLGQFRISFHSSQPTRLQSPPIPKSHCFRQKQIGNRVHYKFTRLCSFYKAGRETQNSLGWRCCITFLPDSDMRYLFPRLELFFRPQWAPNSKLGF